MTAGKASRPDSYHAKNAGPSKRKKRVKARTGETYVRDTIRFLEYKDTIHDAGGLVAAAFDEEDRWNE